MDELRATVIARIRAHALYAGVRDKKFAERLADDILSISEIALGRTLQPIKDLGMQRRD